jgi:SAM-dependent methyltransferase
VLGCGRGHDAAHLAQLGHIVTAIDSSEVAIEQACKLYGDIKNLAFIQADALQLPENLHNSFDLVFEHTLYCAIDPKDRNRLVRSWRQCLTPDGYLLGIFFAVETPLGPPFGGSEWEIETRLGDSFKSIYWTRWKKSNLKRIGTELIVYAQKK